MNDIWHYEGLACWGPIGTEPLDAAVALLALPQGGRVLDIGCGSGEVLARCARRFGAGGVGVDKSEFAIARSRERLESYAGFELLERDASELSFDEGSFDAVIWLGGPYLGGDFETTLRTLKTWARPGGSVLVGHGFWIQPPPIPYLEATGLDPAEFGTHGDILTLATQLGFTTLFTRRSTRDEWDTFEGRIHYNVERHAMSNPDNPDPQGRLEQRRQWFVAQQRWGRETMGFGLYLLANPPR